MAEAAAVTVLVLVLVTVDVAVVVRTLVQGSVAPGAVETTVEVRV